MKTIHYLKLSKPELNHILGLIEHNEREGWYYSPMGQYWNRSNRIKNKIQSMLKK